MTSCRARADAGPRYLDEERLANLVGSVHVWEPGTKVVVYSLGLSDEVRRFSPLWAFVLPVSLTLRSCPQSVHALRSWANVEVKDLPLDTLPPHVADFRGSYAFKAWIISHELETHRACVPRVFRELADRATSESHAPASLVAANSR